MLVKTISKAVSISLGLSFAVFVVFWSPGISQEFTASHVSKQISSNLEFFFEQTMHGCTLRTVFDGISSLSEAVFDLLSGQQMSFKTFIVDEYHLFEKTMLFSDHSGLSGVFQKDDHQPQWLLKKYTSCYTHLYIAEDDSDFKAIIRHHFVDFDLKKESPNYVIIWDLNESPSNYRLFFSQQEFYRTFMDYRLVIRKDLFTSMYDVSLVCIVCPWRFPEGIISPPITPPTSSKIHALWKNAHSNLFGMQLACGFCLSPYDYSQLKYRKSLFQWWVAKLTNTTLSFTKGDVFYAIGEISLNYFVTPKTAQLLFTNVRHPQYTMSPSFLTAYESKMFTVVHKNLLIAPGLGEFVAPLTKLAWCSVAVSLLSIFILSRTVASDMRCSSLLLSILGPLTDHWNLHFSPSLHRIVLLWGILCYSITMLYGGELASSLAILKPPKYPTSLTDLLEISTTIITLNEIGTGTNSKSKLADSLRSLKWIWTEAEKDYGRIHVDRLDQLDRLIHEVDLGRCNNNEIVFNRSNEEQPFLCKNNPYVSKPDKPITFVDERHRHLVERYVFRDSSLYWVSTTSRVQELQDLFPLLLSKNYFAKLVVPFASYWIASGLDLVWQTIDESIHAAWLYSETRTSLNAGLNGESTRVIDFIPFSLDGHFAVIFLCTLLIGVAWLVFLWEVFSGTCVVSFVSVDMRKKLNRNAVVRLKNQKTEPPQILTVPPAESTHSKTDDTLQHKAISLKAKNHYVVFQIKILPDNQEEGNGTVQGKQSCSPGCHSSKTAVEEPLQPQERLMLQELAQSIRQRLHPGVLNEQYVVPLSTREQPSGLPRELSN